MREYDNLVSYLPRVVAQHVVDEHSSGPQALSTQQFDTVCLFADVSGFTKLSEDLAELGSEGIEELANQLNRFVGLMVKLTARAGGDVLKFAGDAMVAFWPPSDGEDRLVRVRRAVQCALDMQQQVDHFLFKMREKVDYRDVADDKVLYEGELRVKLGLGLGAVRIVHLGGSSDNVVSGRFEYVSMGPGLDQAFQCESVTLPGQVVVSKEVYNLVKPYFEFEKIKVANSKKDKSKSKSKLKSNKESSIASKCMRVIESKAGQQNVKWKGVKVGNGTNSDIFTAESETRLWKYVPAAVMPYLQESNEFWAPELRRVTTLFCNLGLSDMISLNQPDKLQATLELLQTVFAKTQAAVFRYEGTINKFLVDDKGTTLIAVFGLPPFAHENDATRGVLSALSVLGGLHESGITNGSVGITTGVVFCGVVGHRGNRREYSVLGDSVNLAARLMQHACDKRCGILIDSPTTEAAWSDLRFVQLNDIAVKGKKGEVEVHQVLFETPEYGGLKSVHSLHMARLSGLTNQRGSKAVKRSHQRVKRGSQLGGDAGGTNIMRIAEMDQVRGRAKLHPLAKVRDKYNLQKSQAKHGAGPHAHMTRLANGLERFEERRGSSIASDPHSTSTKSSASGSSINSKLESKLSAEESLVLTKRYKAAKIRFDNCVTPEPPPETPSSPSNRRRFGSGAPRVADSKPNSGNKKQRKKSSITVPSLFSAQSNGQHTPTPPPTPPPSGRGSKTGPITPNAKPRVGAALTTNYTISLHENVTTVMQVKEEALRWLRDRKLLRNAKIGPEYFELRWADHPGEPPMDESLKLSALDRETPVLELAMVELETPKASLVPGKMDDNGAPPVPRKPSGLSDSRDVVRVQLLEQRNKLLSGQGGSVVLLEGANGVGKTRLISDVLFATGTKTQVVVAAGNPFETGALAMPFSVWREVISQLTEEGIIKANAHAAGGSVAQVPLGSPIGEDEEEHKFLESKVAEKMLLDALQVNSNRNGEPNSPLTLEDYEALDLVLSTNLRHSSVARGGDKMNSKAPPPQSSPTAASKSRRISAVRKSGLSFFSSKPRQSKSHHRNKSASGFGFGTLKSTKESPSEKSASELEVERSANNRTSLSKNNRIVPLLKRIVTGLARSTPTIIVVDDSHHMDASSWELAVEFARDCPSNIMLVLANRKGIDQNGPEGADAFGRIRSGEIPRPASIITAHNRHNMRAYMQNLGARSNERIKTRRMYRFLVASPFTLNLELSPNSMRTADLIKDFLSVSNIPNFLVEHLRARSHGNALFIEDALRAYIKSGLIEIVGDECVLVDKPLFLSQERLHLLPIPSAVESACATQIDALSTAQQIALKTATIIGQMFTLELVKVAFPIPTMAEDLDEEWNNLVDVGILRKAESTMAIKQATKAEVLYEFETMWMADTLHQRMLTKQKRKLHEIISLSLAQAAEQRKVKYMEKSNLAASYSGWVFVRKDHGRNIIKPWKKRWLVLQNDELIQYYDQTNPKRLEVITLSNGGVTSVQEEVGGYHGYETKLGANLYEHCFCIKTLKWSKKGRQRDEPRDFFIAVDTLDEVKEWVYKLNYQIQFFELKSRSGQGTTLAASRLQDAKHYMTPNLADRLGVSPSPKSSNATVPELEQRPSYSSSESSVDNSNAEAGGEPETRSGRSRNTNRAGRRESRRQHGSTSRSPRGTRKAHEGRTSIHGHAAGSRGKSSIAGGVRGGASTAIAVGGDRSTKSSIRSRLARRLSSSPNGPTSSPRGLGILRRGKEKSKGDFEPITEVDTQPGELIDSMTPADFRAISDDENLLSFWETGDMISPESILALRQQHHVSWYYEFGDMALVSRNSAGHIDGYLLGFIAARNSKCGVVHACAVLPSARRHKIATNLYTQFGNRCRERSCSVLRAVVPKEQAIAVAFHRGIGFEEYEDETDALNDIGGGDHIVFYKSLTK